LGTPGLGLPSWNRRRILCGSGRASGEDRRPAGTERASARQIIGRSPRDLRLDFFRGLSLLFIFLDHVPGNVLSFVTLRSFAFCDAAEVFVFISGYTAALVYGRIFARQGLLRATAHVYRRVGQLYMAHVFLFVVLVAEVSFAVLKTNNPMYNEEMGIADFLQEPQIAVVKMLALQFQPNYLDILPLYIVVLAIFPFILSLLSRHLIFALAPSAGLYVLSLFFGWTISTYPDHHSWYFNPLAWQLLFVLGATVGYRQIKAQRRLSSATKLLALAVAIVIAVAFIKFSWMAHSMDRDVPALWSKELFPLVVDKTFLNPLRLLSFLALALVVAHFTNSSNNFCAGRCCARLSSAGSTPFMCSVPAFCFRRWATSSCLGSTMAWQRSLLSMLLVAPS
jgi:hypothetical protein